MTARDLHTATLADAADFERNLAPDPDPAIDLRDLDPADQSDPTQPCSEWSGPLFDALVESRRMLGGVA